jgi:transcription initiation factor TFIID subunit 7
LQFEGVNYGVDLLDLPTVVESYKTLDDINLVKTGDIGQVT